MAAIIRRRRLTIFFIFCISSLLIFSWYSSNHHKRISDNEIITYVYENLIPSKQDLNEKKSHISEQKSEHTIIKQSQIATQFIESAKSNSVKEYAKYNDGEKLSRFENDYEVRVFEETKKHNILDKRLLLEKRISFSNKDEKNYRMPEINHPEQNTNRQTNEGNSKSRGKPTLNDINYSIEKFDDCEACKGYLYSTTVDGKEMVPSTNKPNLILDTPGCKIPKLDPWDPSVSHLIELLDPLECPGPPLFMRPSPDGSISLNKTVLKDYYNMTADELICYYQGIYREHEAPTSRREASIILGNVTKLEFGAPLNEDYVGAACKIKNKPNNFEQPFPLIRLKKKIEEERNARTPPKPQLNIILAGIDSVSKLNFLRHFKRTHSYLNKKMSPFEMNGYTKVGDNTFPNLVAMLTGHFVEHYWNESLKNTMYFDDIDLIWKDYAKRGYRTFFAEDHPMAGTFNYLKRGFYNPPTDYYFRPMALLLEKSTVKHESKDHCLNSQLETDLIYDYLRDFVKAMEHRPFFAFAMVSTLTHDVLNEASWADKPTVNLLDDLSNMGALNNSLLVLFSDHGIRFGPIRYTYIGKYEERMPFMYIHAPNWFLEQYPGIANNLKTNQDRLMTLFDIHATMVHLLDLDKTHKERSSTSLGTSLFDEIPANRTCVEAHIHQHWCPCETFDVIPLNVSEVINASKAIVKDINSQLDSYNDICEILEVDEIMNAMVGKANDIVLRYLRTDSEDMNKVILGEKLEPMADYMITLVTKPGGAVFEGTVRYDPTSVSYNVLGISRINLYGMTSWCIDSQKLKLFCYCKIQKKT